MQSFKHKVARTPCRKAKHCTVTAFDATKKYWIPGFRLFFDVSQLHGPCCRMLAKRAVEKPKDVIKFFVVRARAHQMALLTARQCLQTNNKDQDGSKDAKMEFTVIP